MFNELVLKIMIAIQTYIIVFQFSQETLKTSILPSMPATPDAAAWNTTIQSTPGVIGAQEVYRYIFITFSKNIFLVL